MLEFFSMRRSKIMWKENGRKRNLSRKKITKNKFVLLFRAFFEGSFKIHVSNCRQTTEIWVNIGVSSPNILATNVVVLTSCCSPTAAETLAAAAFAAVASGEGAGWRAWGEPVALHSLWSSGMSNTSGMPSWRLRSKGVERGTIVGRPGDVNDGKDCGSSTRGLRPSN